MRSAPPTSSSRRGTSASCWWSQLVSTNATNAWRASAEVGDRLADEDVEDLARFAGDRVVGFAVVGAAEARDLVVERRIDVEQRAGDVEQRAFVGRAIARDDVVHRIALLQHHVARDAQAHHAERVGDAAQRFHLRLQVGDAGLLGAQVQVERVLDAQQVFLDRRGDGVEQRAIAPAQAAAGMREFGFGRQLRGEVERVAQRVERTVRLLVVGDVVQQLARRFGGGFGARRVEAVAFEDVACFAFDAGEGLAQRARRRQRAVAQRGGHRRGDPQHAARGFVVGAFEQAFDRLRDAGDVRPARRLPATGERIAQRGQLLAGHELAALARQRHRRGQVGGQRAVEVRREQHAFAQTRFRRAPRAVR